MGDGWVDGRSDGSIDWDKVEARQIEALTLDGTPNTPHSSPIHPQDAFELNPPFRTHLRAALASHRAGPWSDPSVPPLKPDPHPQTPQQLEGYMCGKWNAVLHFLVGSANTGGFDEPAEEVGE